MIEKIVRIRFFLLLVLLVHGSYLMPQNIGLIDSLRDVIAENNFQEQKVDALISYSSLIENIYPDSALQLAIDAHSIAAEANNQKGIVKALTQQGYSYLKLKNYSKAFTIANNTKAMAKRTGFEPELANALVLEGRVYVELGDFENSTKYYFESLKISEKFEDKKGISVALGNIGINYFQQQNHEKSLEYINKSLVVAQEIQDYIQLKKQYNNIGVIYVHLQKFDSAIIFLKKALEINLKIGDTFGEGLNYLNIGFGLMNMGEYDEANSYCNKALALFTETGNHTQIAKCNLNLGYSSYYDEKTDKSIIFFNNAINEGQINRNFSDVNDAAKMLVKIYTTKNDDINAFKYVVIEKNALDSLYVIQKKDIVSKYELQYDYEKKEFEDRLAAKAKNNILIVLIISLISGLIVLALVLSRNRLKSKNIKLEKEKIQAELDLKNKELSVNLLSLIKKNEMLTEISEKLKLIEKEAVKAETKTAIINISKEIRKSNDDKMWKEFSARFQEVHSGFYEVLIQKFPDLTQNELKLCAYLRLNMSTKDISELTGQSGLTLETARYRLRKKLGITNSDVNLVTFLLKIN
ncbi:MAG TPA: hypothetical protein DCQ26_04660 [Marinilabiliales bacterium]|nr:MAG: hypothetical protein A2W96_03005 [Bacteroidetes bacterium GWD2_40_43]OFX94111.1 MAG: hypothetical protein A2W97_09185 [Bacteroidetes bacterium GWE2_40_63]OFY18055.1 MAG: hypothetical protein A2W88_18145 [Bacteroidetes bacterium GWF2_40_13]OFZ30261.1 MAG: hypothetical protein A2437_05185 [Bacteroidetes bacterium RIFOXYC2_FULL_40_12]HAM97881.1 hypothetical protein [Marinilabiliales bacterium]